jgi:hypothetical protein
MKTRAVLIGGPYDMTTLNIEKDCDCLHMLATHDRNGHIVSYNNYFNDTQDIKCVNITYKACNRIIDNNSIASVIYYYDERY